MNAALAVPFIDTSADALGWCLAPANGRARARRQPLASVVVDFDWIEVELGVLGASHQVRFRAGGAAWEEVVACDIDGDVLPAMARQHAGNMEYGFRSSIERLPARPFATRVDTIVANHRDDPHALVGVFPSASTAVTVLAAAPTDHGVRWRTWHGYPQTGDLVATVTDVRPR